MPRKPRSYAPGRVFHLTARTIAHARWFEEQTLRDHVVFAVSDCVPKSDAQLLAYAVMSNHFHLIVRQGTEPLSRLMQPLCQSIALRVQRTFGHVGYVFERRFRDTACTTARHIRNAIVYTHRNPVDARMCERECDYRWSSHSDYFPERGNVGSGATRPRVFVPLRLFAVKESASWDELRADYERYACWAGERKRLRRIDAPVPPPPRTPAGDRYWAQEFLSRLPRTLENAKPWRPDLRDLAKATLHEMTPGFTIHQLRATRGGRQVVEVRHEIVARALRMGFRPVDIARYLHITQSVVSRISARVIGTPPKEHDR